MNIFTEASGSLVSAALIRSIKDVGFCAVASDITTINAGGLLADKYIKVPNLREKNLWQKSQSKKSIKKVNQKMGIVYGREFDR